MCVSIAICDARNVRSSRCAIDGARRSIGCLKRRKALQNSAVALRCCCLSLCLRDLRVGNRKPAPLLLGSNSSLKLGQLKIILGDSNLSLIDLFSADKTCRFVQIDQIHVGIVALPSSCHNPFC